MRRESDCRGVLILTSCLYAVHSYFILSLNPPPPLPSLFLKRAIAHSLLEKVDRYLWSPRPNSLPPQLLHVHTREKQQQQTEEIPDTTVFPSVVECSSTLEDVSSHWGVRSKQGAVCGRCQLPLLTAVSDLQSGIIAFCCGESC